MTVRELMFRLSKLPPDVPVCFEKQLPAVARNIKVADPISGAILKGGKRTGPEAEPSFVIGKGNSPLVVLW